MSHPNDERPLEPIESPSETVDLLSRSIEWT